MCGQGLQLRVRGRVPGGILGQHQPCDTLLVLDHLHLGNVTAQGGDGLGDHGIHDLLRGLDVFNRTCSLPHQPRSNLHHLLCPDLSTRLLPLLQVPLHGEHTLGRQFLDLVLLVGLPIHDVLGLAHSHGSPGVDRGADGVMVPSCQDRLLVDRGSPRLLSSHKASPHPHGVRPQGQRHSQPSAVVDAPGCHHGHRLPCQR
mmetsp:Transcript_93077/g.249157  ORF Transcript_93077/g.249157 Transcript_93077/m.249157 type:complete len:200 (+) Transcript_93077:104-703(+)